MQDNYSKLLVEQSLQLLGEKREADYEKEADEIKASKKRAEDYTESRKNKPENPGETENMKKCLKDMEEKAKIREEYFANLIDVLIEGDYIEFEEDLGILAAVLVERQKRQADV